MRATLDRVRLLSLRELFQHRGRALAASTVVAVSTALLVAVLSVIGSIDRSIDNLADGISGGAALEVSAFTEAGFPAAIRDVVAEVPGVGAAVPLVQASASTPRGPVLLLGTDINAAALQGSMQVELRQTSARLLTVPDGVVVGPGTGFEEGDRFRLQNADVTVAAVLSSAAAAKFNGGSYVLAALPLAQRALMRTGTLNSVLIVGDDGANLDALRGAVTQAVDGRALVGDPIAERTRAGNGVQLIRFAAVSSAALAFMVAGFLIYAAMGMAIAGRRLMLSILRAIGGSRFSIVRDLLMETAALALIGGAVGSVLGVFLGRFVMDRLPELFLQSVTARIEFALPVWVIPLAVTVTVAVCVAAAGLAARQVYRVSPVEALMPIGISRADVVRPRLRIAAGVAGIVLAIAAFVNATTQPGILANLGISTMFAAEVALGFAFGVPIVAAAAWVAARFGSAGELAGASIRRSPKRSWATLTTVTVAVAATFAISAGNANVVVSTENSFAALRDADIWVSTTPAGTFPTGPYLPTDVMAAVRAINGVAAVTEGEASYVSLGSQRALAFGIAPDAAHPLVAGVSDSVRASVMAGEGVVVSRDLADALDLRVGDAFDMPTPTGSHTTRVLAEVPFFSALSGAVAISLPQMRQWFDRSGASTLQITTGSGVGVADVLDQVRAVVPQGIYAYTGNEAVQAFGQALDAATGLNHLIWMIVTIIAAVALLNTLLLSVLERRRELAVLRAIGSSRRLMVAVVLAEAGGLAIVGATLGLVFGAVQQVVADLASSRAWNVDVEFALVPVSFVLGAGALALCLAGALPPAWRVARMNIIESIGVE